MITAPDRPDVSRVKAVAAVTLKLATNYSIKTELLILGERAIALLVRVSGKSLA